MDTIIKYTREDGFEEIQNFLELDKEGTNIAKRLNASGFIRCHSWKENPFFALYIKREGNNGNTEEIPPCDFLVVLFFFINSRIQRDGEENPFYGIYNKGYVNYGYHYYIAVPKLSDLISLTRELTL